MAKKREKKALWGYRRFTRTDHTWLTHDGFLFVNFEAANEECRRVASLLNADDEKRRQE